MALLIDEGSSPELKAKPGNDRRIKDSHATDDPDGHRPSHPIWFANALYHDYTLSIDSEGERYNSLFTTFFVLNRNKSCAVIRARGFS
jgi:hypothetical protein